MDYKIVNHENKYLFILDTNPTGFKKGEWMFNEPDNSEILYMFTYDIKQYPIGNKILAHLPINGSPKLKKVLLLPELKPYGKEIKTDYVSNDYSIASYSIAIKEMFAESERNKPASYSAEEMLQAMDEMKTWCFSHDYDYFNKAEEMQNILDKITRAKYPNSFIAEMNNDEFVTYKNGAKVLVVKGEWK